MNIREFLSELQLFFPLERRKEDIPKIFEGYVDDILYELSKDKYKGYDCDFEILLKTVRSKYTFKEFPSIAKIIDFIPEALVTKPRQTSYSGREGEVIQREINGHIYEFTIVPNHWQNVKTIDQLDEEIKFRTKGVCENE